MAGYSRFYVVGGLGGFMDADRVNPLNSWFLSAMRIDSGWSPTISTKPSSPLGSCASLCRTTEPSRCITGRLPRVLPSIFQVLPLFCERRGSVTRRNSFGFPRRSSSHSRDLVQATRGGETAICYHEHLAGRPRADPIEGSNGKRTSRMVLRIRQ